MKKIITMISAFALTAALAVPFSAFAADDVTTVVPVGGEQEFDISPNPADTNATVTLGISPAYIVTIPAEFKLDTADDEGRYSGSGTLSAENVLLNEGKRISVKLTSESKFNMKTVDAKNYALPYTASTTVFGDVNKTDGGKVAEFVSEAEKQNISLALKTDEKPAFAGKYTDPVVFHISIEDEPAKDEAEPPVVQEEEK